jgi:hypothetical protein
MTDLKRLKELLHDATIASYGAKDEVILQSENCHELAKLLAEFAEPTVSPPVGEDGHIQWVS